MGREGAANVRSDGEGASVDPAEIARFSAIAAEWWDPWGPMRALHILNPTRVRYIADILTREIGVRETAATDRPLAGLRLLDIGCGAGVLAEPLARLGADMTAIDPAAANIVAARAHAAQSGLSIDYQARSAEDLATEGGVFDAVLAMEVVEHVIDRPAFIATAASLVRPGGFFFAATLNRTFKSYAFAIVGAERILRWVKPGTHDWRMFVTPTELGDDLKNAGMSIYDLTGVVYNPLFGEWRTSDDCSINYMMAAENVRDERVTPEVG